jgi:hypothetical protein
MKFKKIPSNVSGTDAYAEHTHQKLNDDCTGKKERKNFLIY